MSMPCVRRLGSVGAFALLATAGCMRYGPPPPPPPMMMPPPPRAVAPAPTDERSAIESRIRQLENELRGGGSMNRDAADDALAALGGGAGGGNKDALAEGYVQVAQKYYNELEWEKAKQNLESALMLNPDHPEARRLLTEVRAQLGEHVQGDVGDIMRDAQNEEIVKMKQGQIAVQNHFRKGERYFHDEDYESAVEEFTHVVEAEKWFPFNVDMSGLVRQAQDYLERSKELAQAKARDSERKREAMVQELAKQEEQKRKDMVIERIKRLFEEAQSEFEAERYERAELLCAQLLKTDPNNKHAQELYSIARAAKHAQRDKRNLEAYTEEWRKQFESINMKTIPVEGVEFPDDWDDRVAGRAQDGGTSAEEKMAPEDLEIVNRMKSQNISLNFSETPLPEVISWLREFTNLNIVLKGVDDPAGIKVTFRVDNLPFDQAFDLILRMWELGYKVDQGVIVVTTRANLETETVFQMYRVQDLTAVINDFPAPEISLASPSDDTGGTSVGGAAPPPPVGTDELIELIKGNIAKGTWETAPNSIEINNGLLIVRHTPATQRQIQTLLSDLRRSTGMLVSIESRFLTVEEHFLHDVGIDWRGLDAVTDRRQTTMDDFQNPPYNFFNAENNPGSNNAEPLAGIVSSYSGGDIQLRSRIENLLTNDQLISNFFRTIYSNAGGASLQFTLIDPTLVEAIIRAVERHQRARLLTAPRVTVFNTQRANIFVANQFTYIRDYDVEVAADAVIADPIPGTVQDGITLDVRPTISADRKYITLELRPTVAVLDPPPVISGIYPLFVQTFLGQNTLQTLVARVQIETPRIRIQRVRTTVTMPDGGTLLVGGLTNVYDDRINSGVPVVSDIPIVSSLFDRKVEGKRKRSLLILIRAKIIIMEEEEARRANQ
ncbi:MAG: hypothetical protein HYY93_06655 [Planctomycetes bacterium]|nr:hypothetical protein [Planctomycetota bacterium]